MPNYSCLNTGYKLLLSYLNFTKTSTKHLVYGFRVVEFKLFLTQIIANINTFYNQFFNLIIAINGHIYTLPTITIFII